MTEIDIFLYLIIFAFGTCVGSFLNVCICRIPAGKSIILPPSSCPECSAQIRFYDNIPIISYLILFGKCRYCKTAISIQYPFVEILTGFFAVLVLYYFGFSTTALIYFIFIASLIVITFIDLKEQIIPDNITLSGIVIGFASSFILKDMTPLNSLFGIVSGGGTLFLIAYGYERFRGIEGMGGGDIKLLAMCGAFLGWKAVIMTIFIGSFVGAAAGILVMLLQKKDTKHPIPFGPFLSIGSITYLFFGDSLIKWYLY